MPVVVPDPPTNGEYILMACDGTVMWAERSVLRGPQGPPGIRGAIGPAGPKGDHGRDAPNLKIQLGE